MNKTPNFSVFPRLPGRLPRKFWLDSNKQRLAAFILAMIVGLLSIHRDVLFHKAFGLTYQQDSPGYIGFTTPSRSLPIQAMATLVQAADYPVSYIVLDILIAAFAAGTFVYVVGRLNLALALTIAIFLLTDAIWAQVQQDVLTESAFISFHILSLACLVNQYQQRHRLRRWQLFAAGILYGWTFLIRPSALPLTGAVILGYFYFTRSWRKTAWLTAGLTVFYGGIVAANALIYGQPQLSPPTGPQTIFGLFQHHYFSAENGPSSYKLDQALKSCNVGTDYSKLTQFNAGTFVNDHYFPCTTQVLGTDATNVLSNAAFTEAIRARPVFFTSTVIQNTAIMLSYEVGITLSLPTGEKICSDSIEPWCSRITALATQNMTLRKAVEALAVGVDGATGYVRQPYVRLASLITGVDNRSVSPGDYVLFHGIAAILWLIECTYVFVFTRGWPRILVIAGFFFVTYTAFSVVVVTVTWEPRYTHPFLPFMEIIACCFYFVLFAQFLSACARLFRLRL